jgi:replication factor C large subunit
MEDWTEKYRPKSLKDIVGNEQAVSLLKKWGDEWSRKTTPKRKAVILIGKAGTGKTSSALALANDFGWTIVELNASDTRNATKIKSIVTSGAINETFSVNGQFLPSSVGGRKLIILDEADNLYERVEKIDKNDDKDFSDKGGKRAILDTIRMTKQPIILTVNNYYALTKGSTGASLKETCLTIRYYNIYPSIIINLLKDICRKENVLVDPEILKIIADRCKGDIRSAVNDLQSICLGKKHVNVEATDVLGYRDKEQIIFDVLREIFKTKNLNNIRKSVVNLNETPNNLLLWLDENLPLEYKDAADLVKAYEYLTEADLFLSRIHRRQQYNLWSYAFDLMSCGTSLAKSHDYPNERYRFPTWLSEMSKSKFLRETRDSIAEKIGRLCHSSTHKTIESILPQFKYLFNHNNKFSVKMIQTLNLGEGEIMFLLEEKSEKKLRQLMEEAEKLRIDKKITKEPEATLKITTIKHAELKEKAPTVPERKERQPSLFDF